MTTTPLPGATELAASTIQDLAAARWTRVTDVTITNTPLALEAGDYVARISFRDDRSIRRSLHLGRGGAVTAGTPAATGTRNDAHMSARDLRHVVAFTGLAFALAWLVALPLAG